VANTVTAEVHGGDVHGSDARMALAQRWEDLLDRIRRTVPGMADFQRPPSRAELLRAAAAGPVVLINISTLRCDALIVTARGVRVRELIGLTAGEVAERTAAYLGALNDSGDTDGLSFAEAMRQRAEGVEWKERILAETMRWLWAEIAEPVLHELGYDGAPSDGELPRIWWCPTGLLSLLPIHGAGDYGAGSGACVLDRVISSYTPTLRALLESTAPRARASRATGRLAFVGVPNVPAQPHLTDEVRRERAFLENCFPGGVDAIEGAEATADAVFESLSSHRHAHISCHGFQDLDDPSGAGLELSDGLLAVRRISAVPAACEFVFLSACRTATGGVRLADEAITLAAALSYAGFRHVVATLWSVDPAVAAELAERLYPKLISDGRFDPADAARALHLAVRELRDSGAGLADWLPFVHNGV
jgi:CHAT domain